jgi:hypothetical protein
MGIATFPAASASPIKSIQRGYAASAGAITISSVDTTKAFVRGFSDGSAGSVGATGTETGSLTPTGGGIATPSLGAVRLEPSSFPTYSGTRTFSAGGTNLTSSEFNVYFTNSTTITATGACYWEVVEYN